MKKRTSDKKGGRTRSVSGQLLLVLVPMVTIAILIVAGVITLQARSTIIEQAQSDLSNESESNAQNIGGTVSGIKSYFDGVADLIQNTKFDSDEQLLKASAFALDKFQQTPTGFYMGFSNKDFLDASGWVPDADYDPTTRDWYAAGMGHDSMTTGKAYHDANTDSMVVPLSREIKLPDGREGVMSSDMLISEIVENVSSFKPLGKGVSMLLADDMILSYTDASFNGTVVSEHSGDQFLMSISSVVSSGATGVKEMTDDSGNAVYVSFNSVPNTNWTLISSVKESDVLVALNRFLTISMILMVVMILAIAIIMKLVIGGMITKAMVAVREFAQKLSEGDFTIEPLNIDRKDEIGSMANSLNDMYENNSDVIRNIGDGSGRVSQSSTDLYETSSVLLERFQDVSSSMERVNDAMTSTGAATQQVSASANEVNASVERLAEETKHTKQEVIAISRKAAEIEREGRESSEHAIAIAEKRGKELEEATEAAKVVSEIATMADSIADIANQINLLSLNASIEAARAGEHGRGFAVVAGEINNLASETKSAVEQIQDTVSKIQAAFDQLRHSSTELLTFMRETVAPDYQKFITIGQEYGSDARTFGDLADNISDMVGYISESMEQVNAAVAEIAESATNTASSSAEVTDTITEASGMMERVNEMASDSQEVAEGLDNIVRQFHFND